MSKIKSFFGDKAFYKMALSITLPIMLQNGLTNFVSLLDNIMIGQVGDQQMSGASLANQLLFVFNLCIFGALSGIGIFTSQFFGKRDDNGVRATHRIKIVVALVILIVATLTFFFFGNDLIMLYLKGDGTEENAEAILGYGSQYLRVILIGLPFYAIAQVYATTMREVGNAKLPMKAGVIAILVNLVFNYILIYGKLGFPAMGVIGAAVATNISRVLEFLIIIIATHGQREKYGFINDLYKKVNITKDLLARVLKQGLPLLINEALWSSGMAFLNQCYSYTSQDVVPALNIESTIWNLLSVTFMAFGIAVGIITGHNLGARDFELAKANAKKLMTMSFLVSIVISLVSIGISFTFPLIYNTTNEIRALSTSLIIVSSAFMPLDSLSHSSYFVLRSGGKTWLTFIFDSLYVWFIFIPIAFCLSRFTNLSVVPIMALVQSTLLFKSIMGVILVKKGVWINNIVENT